MQDSHNLSCKTAIRRSHDTCTLLVAAAVHVWGPPSFMLLEIQACTDDGRRSERACSPHSAHVLVITLL